MKERWYVNRVWCFLPHYYILPELCAIGGEKIANPPPGTMTQTLSALNGHPIATNLVALAMTWAVHRAVAGEFCGLVPTRMGATPSTDAVDNTNATLYDVIVAGGVGALLSHMPALGILAVVGRGGGGGSGGKT